MFSTVSKKTGKTYHLHSRKLKLNGGREFTSYFFAGDVRVGSCEFPPGHEIIENERTGLPMLRKIREAVPA